MFILTFLLHSSNLKYPSCQKSLHYCCSRIIFVRHLNYQRIFTVQKFAGISGIWQPLIQLHLSHLTGDCEKFNLFIHRDKKAAKGLFTAFTLWRLQFRNAGYFKRFYRSLWPLQSNLWCHDSVQSRRYCYWLTILDQSVTPLKRLKETVFLI